MQGLLRAGRALRKGSSQAATVVRISPGASGVPSQHPDLAPHTAGLIRPSLQDGCNGGHAPCVSALQEVPRSFGPQAFDSALQNSHFSVRRLLLRASADFPPAPHGAPCPGVPAPAALSQSGCLPPTASCLAANASCHQLAGIHRESVASWFQQSAIRNTVGTPGSNHDWSYTSFASGSNHSRPLTSFLSGSPLSFHPPLTPLNCRAPLTTRALSATLRTPQHPPNTRMQHTQENQVPPKRRAPGGQGREQGAPRGGEQGQGQGQETRLVTEQEDVFDSITDKIPERPVTVAEGASYSFVILLGLGIALGAVYFAAKELLLEPKEYKVFNRALARVQKDAQVVSYLGSPITGYGQDSRNRAARQRISHKVWKDEEGVEKTLVQFHVRGPGGAGLVHCEMFQDPGDKGKLKFTYLVVDITTPAPRRLMLESYVPE